MEASQVRTKKRVLDHGEVLTGQREVNAMLDLLKQETERIDSRFLEPACGDGNFLAKRGLAFARGMVDEIHSDRGLERPCHNRRAS